MSCVHKSEELTLLNCSYCANPSTDSVNAYQDLSGIVYRNRQKILKSVWNYRRPQKAKAILRKEKAGDITLPSFQIV